MGRLCLSVVLAGAIALVGAGAASARTVWLCRPGLAHDPCAQPLDTTRFDTTGVHTLRPRPARPRKIDCFYVAATVSDEKTLNADRRIHPEDASIARFEAARFSQYCRVFAPMYRQVTVLGLTQPLARQVAGLDTAYRNLLAAWRTYLRRYNHGRGFVIIGHSQGSALASRLIRTQIDARPALRRRLVSAILPGANVTVPRGRLVGGSFRHIPPCRRARQLHCVIAYSTFDAPPPPNALFGRATVGVTRLFRQPGGPRYQVLCTNPAALGGGSAPLDSIFPTKPFAPGTTIGVGSTMLGVLLPTAPTTWIEVRGTYDAHCSSAGGANVLQVMPHGSAPLLTPAPGAVWGLHLIDIELALGDLVADVRHEAATYARQR